MTRKEFEILLSQKDYKALAPFHVDNAIILSAGFSSRFRPLSEICPKALLSVHGEVLIERQIRQLQEAGIDKIYVIVGYKKELYEYLKEKYGVILIENKEYATRNNNSSIYAAKDILGNSYVCCSDNYFPENVFSPYVYDSYYSALYADGETNEFCMDTDKNGRITHVTIGGKDSYYMLGHTYWSREFSEKYLRYLKEEYNNPETAGLYWENIYMNHIDELSMYLNPYKEGAILEFDNLGELCRFDASYIKYSQTLDPSDLPTSYL